MKINELISLLKLTKKQNKELNFDVNFFIGEKEYEIDEINQFRIIPDITVRLKRK